MKRLFGGLMCAVLFLSGVSSHASEPVASGTISGSNLASLGLAGMTVISDDAGTQVRGMGNSAVGSSYAWGFLAPLSYSHNTYTASGTSFSRGGNTSFAGLGNPFIGGTSFPIPLLGGIGGFITGTGALAGGGSFAQNN